MNKVAQTLSAVCLLFFANQAHGQWAPTGGPESASVGELVVSGDAVFARTGEGVYRLTNDGASWTAVDNGLTDLQIYALAAHGDTIFAGTEDMNGVGQIYRSTNNGASWTVVNNGLIDRRIHALAARGDTIFAGAVDKNGVGQVYRSTNNGSSWTEVNSGLPNMIVFYAFALSGRAIFAGTLEDGVYRSVNSGVSWTAVNSGLTDHEIVSFAVNNDTIFAGAASGVYRSTNNGALWTAVNNGLTDKLVTALAVSGNNIFAGSKSCVYLSTNNGASWTAVNTGLPNADSNAVMTITALAVCGGSLYVGVGGNGVWRRPLSEMLTASPALPPNHPKRPFQNKILLSASGNAPSGVNVRYSVASHGFVRLALYAVSGKQEALYNQGEQAPGEYSLKLERGAIPAGLYVYRFQAGNFRESDLVRIMN